MIIKVLYFAWLREHIGHNQEQLDTDAQTPAQLVQQLRAKGPEYELALRDLDAVRVSINQVLADFDDPIPNGAEVAFFPPMTGG